MSMYSVKADKPGSVKMWWANLPDETLLETAWERQMNISGMEAYENTRNPKQATQTVAGQKFLRSLLDKVDQAILDMQRKLITTNRVDRNLKSTVLIVPSDTTSMITLKAMIDRSYGATDPGIGAAYQGVATDISKSVELELNFRHWVETSKEASKAYAKVEGLARVPRSLAERLIEEQGVCKRTLIRWKQSFSELSQYKWDTLEKHYCGDALLITAANALPEYFDVHLYFKAGKKQKFLRMTEKFRKDFDNLEFSVAGLQITKKPMLKRPKKWIPS